MLGLIVILIRRYNFVEQFHMLFQLLLTRSPRVAEHASQVLFDGVLVMLIDVQVHSPFLLKIK